MQAVPRGRSPRSFWRIWSPGDYVMVHAGAAISKITSDDQTETEELLEELL